MPKLMISSLSSRVPQIPFTTHEVQVNLMIPNNSWDLSLHFLLRIQRARPPFLLIPPRNNNLLPILQRNSHQMLMLARRNFELARVNPVGGLEAQEGWFCERGAGVIGDGEGGERVVVGAEG